MRFILSTRPNLHILVFTALLATITSSFTARQARGACLPNEPAAIERLKFSDGGGHGYRMRYCIALPLQDYWQFKTNFDNDFLISNPHIRSHRFIARQGDMVLTENSYAHNSKRLFRWQTDVNTYAHRLDFKLKNPEEAGQDFHFGSIQLSDHGAYTVVYQEARFKFPGDALWTFYPWRGGMRSFLQSFVAWEQRKALEWDARHHLLLNAQPEQRPARLIFSRNWRHPEK